jgi:hypothetical protein
MVYHSKRSPNAITSQFQPELVHLASSIQLTVPPVPSPQQYRSAGLPFVTPAQSGQFKQFSPLSGWQIPSLLQVEVGDASVVVAGDASVVGGAFVEVVACDVVVVATTEVVGGTVVVTGSSDIARQFVASWREDTYEFIASGTRFGSLLILPCKLALLSQFPASLIPPTPL